MQPAIAFVNDDKDCGILQGLFPAVRMARATPGRPSVPSQLAKEGRMLWVDPMIDGYDLALKGTGRLAKAWSEYRDSLEQDSGEDAVGVLTNPNDRKMRKLVNAAMKKCTQHVQPRWITVPQLPVVSDKSRNKVNRSLAKATGDWRSGSGYAGKLVLPLVFTHQSQIKNKTNWKPKIETARKCYADAGASVVWAVDASLVDQSGAGTLPKRLGALVDFHKALQEAFPDATIVAGPYWGMNLVLWARQLCDCPAICLGRGYRYSVPSTFLKTGKERIAIPPLLRWATASPELRKWLDEALKALSPQDPAHGELSLLKKGSESYNKRAADRQVAEFYSQWLERLAASPPAGRALALYQEFSSAFVLGRQLPTMPKAEGTARRPERVAEQLMLHCL